MSNTVTEPTLSTEQIYDAVRNEYPGQFFELGDRKFPVKDLSYDSYVEFCQLARPILAAVTDAVTMDKDTDGNPDIDFNPASFDIDKMISLAGKELPRMAWLCLKQSDPKLTVEDVKALARRPQALIAVVIKQVQINRMVEEFTTFFQQLVRQIQELAPKTAEAAAPIKMTQG